MHATQELDHANRLAERVQQLGGVPIYDPKEISSKAANVGVVPEQGATPTEMVVEDLLLERQQIEVYSALIREIGDRDLITRHVLVGILAETESTPTNWPTISKEPRKHRTTFRRGSCERSVCS